MRERPNGYAVDAGRGMEADIALARLARETDDRNARVPVLDRGGDPAAGFDRVFFECVALE